MNSPVSGVMVTLALDNWLSLERHHTPLNNLGVMKTDIGLPLTESFGGMKTIGHINKGKIFTLAALGYEGMGSLAALAKSSHVWGKVTAGFVVKPRYLSADSQEGFIQSINAQPTDLSALQKLEALDIAGELGDNVSRWEKGIIHAREQAMTTMEHLRQAALDSINPITTPELIKVVNTTQMQFYGLAMGAISVQMARTDYDYGLCGILEPGTDANATKILSLNALTAA